MKLQKILHLKKKINLITIDVENYEYEVLKNFNFKKYKVDLIVAECLDISQKKLEIYTQSLDFIIKSKLYKLLIKNNYKLINWVNSDLVFFNKKSKIQHLKNYLGYILNN